jgi:hypothetical protein
MPQFVRMQRAMCVRKTVVGQGTYMLAPRSYRLLVSALGFALLASIMSALRRNGPRVSQNHAPPGSRGA